MKLGIGLPGYLGTAVTPDLVLDWARAADQAGFHALAVHDRPDHDAWDPLTTLAAVAPITSRARLATTILILPARDEGLVAKQAALVDQLSGGRLDLGVALGGRPDDYGPLGHEWAGRGKRFERQLDRLDELFAAAVERGDEGGILGPPPVQRPRPKIWVGGYTPAAITRAVSRDGYLFGAAGIEGMGQTIPKIRAAAEEAGKTSFPIGGLAYIAATDDPDQLALGERMLLHYYGSLRKPFNELVHSGDEDALRRTIDGYRNAGVDVLYLYSVLPGLEQVDRLARLLS